MKVDLFFSRNRLGGLELFMDPQKRYWGAHQNPSVTSDIIRRLPKADLHVRLYGSVSAEGVWYVRVFRCSYSCACTSASIATVT